VSEQNKINFQNPSVIKLYITSVNSMSYFVMINLKATNSCSMLHVGLAILCCYETPWRWHLCAETCSSWQFRWGVFCDKCFIVFYTVKFLVDILNVRKYTAWKMEYDRAIAPVTPPGGWWLKGWQPLCCITHVQHSIAQWYCASCSGSKLHAQQYTANCNWYLCARHTPTVYERLSNDRSSTFGSATSRYYVIQIGNFMEGIQKNSRQC